MDIGLALGGIFAFCAVPSIFRVIKGDNRGRAYSKRVIETVSVFRMPKLTSRHRLRWITTRKLKQMIASDPEMVVFCLADGVSRELHGQIPGQVDVTLPQLEKALPWIPYKCRIAICSAGGVSKVLARKLVSIAHGREIFVVSGPLNEIDSITASGEIGN
jgi:hypothetical protein